MDEISNKEVVQQPNTTETAQAGGNAEPLPENTEIAKLKAALSKANSEAAANKRAAEEWKRQLREKQTETERAEAERLEREKQREARIAELEAKERISTYKDQLLAAGIEAEYADLMAKALPDGVGAEYFAATKASVEAIRKNLVGQALASQPGLSVGTPPQGKTAEALEMETLRRNIGL